MRVKVSLCVLTLAALLPSAAKAGPVYNQFITFDVPGGINAAGSDINDSRDVVGNYNDANNTAVVRGFQRTFNGTFTNPIIAPGDNTGLTRANGNNNAGTIVGDYLEQTPGPVFTFHGYTLKNGNFTQYDIGGPVSTSIFDINNQGHFAGTFGSNVQPNQGFLNKNGVVETFTVDPTLPFFALGLNDLDTVVGQYTDGSNVTHGYVRDDGAGIITPLDVPNSQFTSAAGINNLGWIAGSYQDLNGATHGFVDVGGSFLTIDVPGSTFTQVFGINNNGDLTGTFGDSRGFIALAVPEPATLVPLGIAGLALWGYRRRRGTAG